MSSRGTSGQLVFSHDGPSAFLTTSAGESRSEAKNSCHSLSTEEGSFS